MLNLLFILLLKSHALQTKSLPIEVLPSQNFAEILPKHPAGTSFLFKKGVHRGVSLTPRTGDSFLGEEGAILNGSQILTGFNLENSLYTLPITLKSAPHGSCQKDHPLCNLPEMFFVNEELYTRVATIEELGPHSWLYDSKLKKLFLKENPTGKLVELALLPYALNGRENQTPISNVSVRNLTIEKYACAAQSGAVGGTLPGTNWTIEHNEIRNNHGVGIKAGSGSLLYRNRVHHNGQLGISATGENTKIFSNEIYSNNTLGFDFTWEAGGAKFTRSHHLKVRCNYVHENDGPGLWTDICNHNAEHSNNLVVKNSGEGIFHEISFAAKIIKNTVIDNGIANFKWLYGSQILISTSSDVEVSENKVQVPKSNANGITIIQQRRTSSCEPHFSKNNTVHHNQITYLGDKGVSGIAADPSNYSFGESKNVFDENQYFVSDLNDKHWQWGSQETFSQFQKHKQESKGTIKLHTVETSPALEIPCDAKL